MLISLSDMFISGALVGISLLKFPFVIFSNMPSASLDRLEDEMFWFLENSTWNFVSSICFRIVVFRSSAFLIVNILVFGSI